MRDYIGELVNIYNAIENDLKQARQEVVEQTTQRQIVGHQIMSERFNVVRGYYLAKEYQMASLKRLEAKNNIEKLEAMAKFVKSSAPQLIDTVKEVDKIHNNQEERAKNGYMAERRVKDGELVKDSPSSLVRHYAKLNEKPNTLEQYNPKVSVEVPDDFTHVLVTDRNKRIKIIKEVKQKGGLKYYICHSIDTSNGGKEYNLKISQSKVVKYN